MIMDHPMINTGTMADGENVTKTVKADVEINADNTNIEGTENVAQTGKVDDEKNTDDVNRADIDRVTQAVNVDESNDIEMGTFKRIGNTGVVIELNQNVGIVPVDEPNIERATEDMITEHTQNNEHIVNERMAIDELISDTPIVTSQTQHHDIIADALEFKYNSLKNQISKFALITSIQSLLQVRNAKSVLGRLIWFAITLFVCSLAIIGVHEITRKYLDHPSEDILYSREELVTFPSVTICGVKPVVFTDEHLKKKLSSRANTGDTINTWIYHDYRLKMLESRAFSDEREKDHERINAVMRRIVSEERYIENLNEWRDYRLRMYDDLILECRFKGKPCGKTDFKQVMLGRYGNCFTFQPNSKDDTNILSEPGPDFGLNLMLFTNSFSPLDEFTDSDTFNYIKLIGSSDSAILNEFNSDFSTASDGIRLSIHAPGTMPDPEKDGIDLSTGTFSSIGLSQDVRTLLGPPHGNCTEERLNTHTTYTYTQNMCLRQCQQIETIKRCKCMNPKLPLPPLTEKPHKIHYCGYEMRQEYLKEKEREMTYGNVFPLENVQFDWKIFIENFKLYECEKEVTELFSREGEKCGCKRECKSTAYYYLKHSIPWPNERYYKGLKHRNFISFLRNHPKADQFLNKTYWSGNRLNRLGICMSGDNIFSSYSSAVVKGAYPYLTCPCNIANSTDQPDRCAPIINWYRFINKFVETNFLKVNVFYSTLNVNRIAAEPSYPFNKWLSDFGGIIGMNMGMSVVSLVELGYLMVSLAFILYCKHKRDN
ncbi:unnamed protein product [Owenia fusiformis]|uniref:Uncharacterized protein n=1 Tax=Owenia fusiformis TaxID=6347 RepID=A0A8J1TFP6_OWEFU|nr:unnamed protein product [Owenia fusiformis]